MNWLTLAYFLSLGTLSYDGRLLGPDGMVTFQTPPITFQTTLGVEAQLIDNHLFVGGSVQTWENPNGSDFNPFEAFYIFSAGLRGWGFELGYRHECDHPIVSKVDFRLTQGWLSARDEFYLSFTGKLRVF